MNNQSSGLGLASLLLVLFIGLKLAGVITWSWFWVLSPLWISLCISILLIVVVLWVFLKRG